jgi:hypothetical protein
MASQSVSVCVIELRMRSKAQSMSQPGVASCLVIQLAA